MNTNLLKLLPFYFVALISLGCSDNSKKEDASAFLERSIAYERQGQFRAALIESRNAIQSDPSDIKYTLRYADLLMIVGNPAEAEKLLTSQDKDHNEAIALPLANALLMQGKFVSASKYLNIWPDSKKTDPEYIRLASLQTYMSGDKESAINLLSEAVSAHENSRALKIELAKLLIETKNWSKATKIVQHLTSAEVKDPETLYLAAKVHYGQSQLDTAEAELTEALFLSQDTDILLNSKLQILELLSSVLTELGRFEEAIVYNQIIRKANPDAFLAKQQFKDAIDAASEGDLLSAKSTFEDILAQFPNNRQAALMLGLIHLEEGNISQGESLLTENLDPETAPQNIVQATALAQVEQGKPEAALSVLEKALMVRPDDIELLSLYGTISLGNDETDQGVRAVSKALQLDPSRTRLRLLLGQYYTNVGANDLALGHLRSAFNENPEDWPTTTYYLTTLIQLNEEAEALKVREQISNRFQAIPAARWALAVADYQLGRIESALSLLSELHTEAPENLNTIKAIARIYEKKANSDLAADMWLKALALEPLSQQPIAEIIRLKRDSLSSAQLIEWLNEQARITPEAALPLHAASVELLVKLKRLEEATQLASAYTGQSNRISKLIEANVLSGSALSLAEQNSFKEALEQAKKAYSLVPDSVPLAILTARLHSRNGNSDEAIRILDSKLISQSRDIRLIKAKAEILTADERGRVAYSFLSDYWLDRPSPAIAQLYYNLEKKYAPERLRQSILDLLKLHPDNTLSLITLAGIELEESNIDASVELYKKALVNDQKNVTVLNNLAWLLRESEQESALQYAKTAADIAPDSASVLDTYGWVLHLSGNTEEAIKILDKAIQLDPGNTEIIQHRRSIN
ncbi:tetratricopeptide repeat protein [Reinekea sp. G2M2-21]|uniref:tetratricopeptide repeat protein n=1 Tax=Reinekea sp. G2M2-21 TaxID=2788942 RepID=UPI0018AC58C2|nr:tetratricopeptide repeat protein [Reinekea sp. G2M2-21]